MLFDFLQNRRFDDPPVDVAKALAALEPHEIANPSSGLLYNLEHSRSIELIAALIDVGLDVDAATPGDEYTMLWMAAYYGDTDMIEGLLDLGADPEKRYGSGYPVWLESFFGMRCAKPSVVRAMMMHPRSREINTRVEVNGSPLDAYLHEEALEVLREIRSKDW